MKLPRNKKIISILLPLVLVVGVFIFGHNTAAASDWAVTIVSGLLGIFIWALGVILVLVIHGLILIASYQNFIGSAAVGLGWIIVRDICNMFFSVVLLIIAFGTILHQENYNYKKWLPKLILMAILINFSKTICGLLIDAAQVVMLTFVNAFKDVGGANLTDILGLSEIVTMAKDNADMSLWTVVGAYILGIIYMLVAVVVITTMMMMLVMRLVMIWIYVVLSPFAYLLSVFPGGQAYASKWWSEFTKNLIIGPVLAFFIWLSFAALQTYSADTSANAAAQRELQVTGSIDTSGSNTSAPLAGTKASTPEALIKFVIAIGMLLGGLKIAQEIGGSAGSIAGKGIGKLQKGAAFATGVGAAALAGARKKAWKSTKRVAGTALGSVDRYVGAKVDTHLLGGKNIFAGKGLVTKSALALKNAPGNLSTKLNTRFNRNKELDKSRREYLEQTRRGEEAVLSFNSKRYKKEEGTDKFYEIGANGQKIVNAQGQTNYLKTGEPGKEKEVKAMNDASAAWHDAWRTSGSQSRAISNKAQEEKISKEQQVIADSGDSTDEMRRELMDASTSATKKMALGMTLAAKNGFKSSAEIKEAKKYLGSNNLLQSKFDDEVNKTQAHLNYDLTVDAKGDFKNMADVDKFKKNLDIGKIDPTKISEATLKAFSADNSGGLKVLKDHYGADYGKVMEANYNNRNINVKNAISAGELNHRKLDGNKLAADDKSAILHAKLTGRIEESFNVNGQMDVEALQNYIEKADAASLNKIDMDNINKLSAEDQKKIKKALASKLDLGRLKNMQRLGTNSVLVKTITQEAKDSNAELFERSQVDAELRLEGAAPAPVKKVEVVGFGGKKPLT